MLAQRHRTARARGYRTPATKNEWLRARRGSELGRVVQQRDALMGSLRSARRGGAQNAERSDPGGRRWQQSNAAAGACDPTQLVTVAIRGAPPGGYSFARIRRGTQCAAGFRRLTLARCRVRADVLQRAVLGAQAMGHDSEVQCWKCRARPQQHAQQPREQRERS
ncbi:MAG: hypothetical protein RL685_4096 [Pseudomonadota bacterium]|jgi:hypothetical protein